MRAVATAVAAMSAAVIATEAVGAGACQIANSACYPWRIEGDKRETTLLEVVPNNALTGVIYRVCLCPPSKSVGLVFRFESRDVEIGDVSVTAGGPVCRDFRIETTRSSRLLLRRTQDGSEPLEGCYLTAPTSP